MKQKELEKLIKEAQDAYYNSDEPIMTDAEFDALWDELSEKYPNSKLLKEVGEDSVEGFKKVKHLIRAGSQQKATNIEQIEKLLKKSTTNVTVSEKLDGASVVMYYTNGKLKYALSRGNGVIGDDATKNVLKMNYVIPKLVDKVSVAIRGEVLLSRKNKQKYFPDMKNCRNAGNGIFKRLDGQGCEYLDVVVYDAQMLDNNKAFKTQSEMISFMERNGFKVVNYKHLPKTNPDELMSILNKKFDKFDELEYDIDGIVVKSEKYDVNDMQEARPEKQFAIKPKNVETTTKLKDIVWECSSGTFTPIAILKPVKLQGTTVSRASLCNLTEILRLGIKIGDTVRIVKSNMIIPKVIGKAE